MFNMDDEEFVRNQREMFYDKKFEAMLEVEDDSLEPGLIVQEIQPGYMFQERLLRPSFVAVSKKKKTDKDKKQDNKGK